MLLGGESLRTVLWEQLGCGFISDIFYYANLNEEVYYDYSTTTT